MKIFPAPVLATATLIAAALSLPAFAGDATKGEAEFKKCKSCHAVTADDGTAIVKGGKVGPDLYGVIGRQIGSFPDYQYGASLVAAGADGSTWDEASLAAYVTDPTAWLNSKLGVTDAKAKMTFKLAKGGEDVAAYLAALKPAQ
jgi:cytochrome c